ncbi:NUDIX domain-containing protein [Colwellia sp. 1_MG-2023]|uniref:NUDIX domain-containing protein n=1 Tax=Colwellia sp. 1_MG-2023 TaxID=3062649 RepID=UPI0026E1E25C|nr:NUDIX domain-containing protein [Colwellia sp. 1_MG-2023]MDO6445564.1 NUDIX domain-containing protein [Colwellia sp. 1_MG-2023]
MNENINKTTFLRFSHQDVELKERVRKYAGFFNLDQYVIQHKLFSGRTSDVIQREIFERGDAVVLIPYDPVLDQVVLIEQFRPGALRAGDTPWMLEFIAGMFEEGEQPVDVAIREAKEEANLDVEAKNVTKVMKYLSSPGGMSEAIYLYLATVDSRNVGGVYGLEEEGEDILVHVVKRTQALELLSQGKIANAATVIGLQWLALNHKSIQEKIAAQ